MSFTTILHHLELHASLRPEQPALHDKVSGQWRTTTWHEYNQLTRESARAMLDLGIAEGDVVTILGADRPEWVVGALAAMRVGAISAGIYTTCSAEEIGYIVGHSESRLIIVETLEQLSRLQQVWDDIPTLQHAVLMDDAGQSDDERVMSWTDFLARAAGVEDHIIDSKLDELRPDQVADFIYTSGTTGPPKAVMLTHENLAWTAQALGESVKLTSSDAALSYLPLSHIAEQMSSMLMPVTFGYEVYFCHEGIKVADYLKESRPTVFFGVPRVWERFESGIKGQLSQADGAKAKIAEWAMGVSGKVVAAENTGESPNPILKAQHAVAHKLVLGKLRAALGFDRTRVFVSGAAPIPSATLEYMSTVGIPIVELYGQSEDSGPTSTNLPGANKYGTVGRPLPGVDVKVADDGEILVRGKNVFAGYFKHDQATAETLIDGWLHSGDLGEFDDDGYLSIVGRKKDIIITSGGKNIAPQNIEEALCGIDVVSSAVVVGEQQRFLVALLTLEPDAASRFASEHGVSSDVHDSSALREHLELSITRDVNPLMARVEHIRNFVVLASDFSTETGELTPTFKIKRNVVNEKYAHEIAAAYEAGQVL